MVDEDDVVAADGAMELEGEEQAGGQLSGVLDSTLVSGRGLTPAAHPTCAPCLGTPRAHPSTKVFFPE